MRVLAEARAGGDAEPCLSEDLDAAEQLALDELTLLSEAAVHSVKSARERLTDLRALSLVESVRTSEASGSSLVERDREKLSVIVFPSIAILERRLWSRCHRG